MEMALTPALLKAIEDRYGPEAAQTAAMSTSVGGIGPLLRERVVAQGDLGLDVVGVSLLYNTVWNQGWQAWNHLTLDRRIVSGHLRGVLEDTGLTLALDLFDGTRVDVKVWKAPYGAARAYFLDAPAVSDVVYPGAEDAPPKTPDPHQWTELQRMKQSWLVGRGALALAKALNFSPDVIVLSETPTLFAHPRLVADGFSKDPLFAGSRTIFNDHTPLEYAHPIWPETLLREVRMDPAVFGPFVKNGVVDITQLLVAVSNGVFGVARKHADVMRAMPSLAPYAQKIQYITNGVSRDYWQAPSLRAAENLTDADLLATKDKLRGEFVDWLWRRALLWPHWVRAVQGKPIVLWTRRITSYKRLDLLAKIFDNPAWRQRFLDAEVVLVVGGRVYQRDNVSEKMVYNLVERLNMDQPLGDRVIFLHNFNVWDAPRLFWGADGAIMLSDDGREASATGFMKAQMNGGVILANPDGAVPEFVFGPGSSEGPHNGFIVTYKNGQPDPESFLDALQSFGRAFRVPAERAALMRNALAMTPRVGVDRTAREMSDFYQKLPATV